MPTAQPVATTLSTTETTTKATATTIITFTYSNATAKPTTAVIVAPITHSLFIIF